MKLEAVKALPDYHIWIRFEDGVEGEVDLSHLVGDGIFALWNDAAFFEQVRVGEFGEIAWSDQLDLCADSFYLQLTGLSAQEAFSQDQAA